MKRGPEATAGAQSARAEEIEAQFGPAAEMYARSEFTEVEDLDLLAEWARPRPDQRALDVATGAGHAALYFAHRVGHVTATDLSPRMLQKARELFAHAGLENVDFEIADVQRLPFADSSFDLVSSRIAPHHFLDIRGALREVARVLRPGGRLLLVDSVAPDDAAEAAFLDAAERRRDPTHVCTYGRAEWVALCRGAGLETERWEVRPKRHDFESWLRRAAVETAAADEMRRCFRSAAPSIRAAFRVELDAERIVAFTDEKIILSARRC